RLARKKDVVLAREACGLAPNVSQYFLIVADERFRGRRSDPVVVLAIDTHPPLTRLHVVGTEPGLLQAVPVHLQFLAPTIDAGPGLPVRGVLPRGIGRESPGAMSSPVVGDVPGEDLLPVVELARPDLSGVVPAVPEVPLPKLVGLPAEVALFGVGH